MTFAINGTTLLAQPTDGHWRGREEKGVTGAGKPVYSAVREYELRWDFLTPAEYNQLQGFYFQSATGTLAVTLPRYGHDAYEDYIYSGCCLSEPEYGVYFEQYYQDVVLLVRNIHTAGVF